MNIFFKKSHEESNPRPSAKAPMGAETFHLKKKQVYISLNPNI